MADSKVKSKRVFEAEQKKRKTKRKKVLLWAGGIFLGVILISFAASMLYMNITADTCQTNLQTLTQNQGVQILDEDGQIYYDLTLVQESRWISIEDVPEVVTDACYSEQYGNRMGLFLSAYLHSWNPNDRGSRASTWLTSALGIRGSMKRAAYAAALEEQYSQEELAEYWLNLMNPAPGVYGLQNTALCYFRKPLSQLSEEEFSQLMTFVRTEHHLDELPYRQEVCTVADNAFADALIRQLAQKLKEEKGYSEKEVWNEIYFGGLVVDSTVSATMQSQLEKQFRFVNTFTTVDTNEYPQAAMVILDYTGAVKAIEDGNKNRYFARADGVLRQVGSAIKPVSTYSMALENDVITYSSMIPDVPVQITQNGETVNWPTNSDGHYDGNITVAEAIQVSKNAAAVQLVMQLGEEDVYKRLKEVYHFDTLMNEGTNKSDKQSSALALGYFEEGITLAQLTAAFAPFGNGGSYPEVYYFTTVRRNGKVILEDVPQQASIMSEETAWIMNRLLKNPVTASNGTAVKAAIPGVEVVGKTGTVAVDEGTAARLFVGLTPNYVAGVVLCYDDDTQMNTQTTATATSVWQRVMSTIPAENTVFSGCDTVVEASYCKRSGLLATPECGETAMGYYKENCVPEDCNQCGK